MRLSSLDMVAEDNGCFYTALLQFYDSRGGRCGRGTGIELTYQLVTATLDLKSENEKFVGLPYLILFPGHLAV